MDDEFGMSDYDEGYQVRFDPMGGYEALRSGNKWLKSVMHKNHP